MVTGISLSGLVSGMDTDGIIKELMELERLPIRKMEFKKQEITTKQEQWQTVNQQMQGLKGSFDDLKSRTIYNSMSASSSNEDVISVSADSSPDPGNYAINVDQLAQAHSVYGTRFADSTEPINSDVNVNAGVSVDGAEQFTIDFADGTETFTIDLADLDKPAEDITIRDIRGLINQQEGLEATATIVDNRLVINSDNTGVDSELVLSDTNGTLLQDMEIIDGNGDVVGEMQQPQDAVFSINGLTGITSSTNQGIDDVIDGLSFDLHTETGGQSVNLSVGQDTEGIEKSINQFVELYNEAQTFMKELGKEEGLLQGDGTLRRLQSSLRSRITTDVGLADNEYTNIQSLGIEIDEEGVMSFEASELQAALRENPEDVESFFRASETDDGADGMARRMSGFIEEYVRFGNGILNRQDSNFTSRLDRIDSRIETRKQRIEKKEQNLQRQFVRMETALNEIQAQGSWLQGQLQSLGNLNDRPGR